MSNLQAWDSDRALARIRELKTLDGALLPILHALQEDFGYVDHAAVPMIAKELNLSNADVHGVITFYHDFRHEAPGRHVLKICRAEACQSMGCDKTIAVAEAKAGVKLGGTSADGSITVEAVYCLGLCAMSPAAMLDGKPYGRVTGEVVEMLMDSVTRGRRA